MQYQVTAQDKSEFSKIFENIMVVSSSRMTGRGSTSPSESAMLGLRKSIIGLHDDLEQGSVSRQNLDAFEGSLQAAATMAVNTLNSNQFSMSPKEIDGILDFIDRIRSK